MPLWALKEDLNGVKLRLLTAAIGKPVPIGGFDIRARIPKKMRRAVPAGSVYYFEVEDESRINDVIQWLHNRSVSDQEEDRRQGFGIAYIGRID